MGLSHRMRRFLPQLFWTGVSIAFYSGALTPMIIDTVNLVGSGDDMEDYRL